MPRSRISASRTSIGSRCSRNSSGHAASSRSSSRRRAADPATSRPLCSSLNADLRVRQGAVRSSVSEMCPNSVGGALEELPPGRRVEEQVADLDASSRRSRPPPADRRSAPPRLKISYAASLSAVRDEDPRVRDRPDARQRLAAKAHRARCGTDRRRSSACSSRARRTPAASSSGGIPPPSSITRISSRPPSSISTSDLRRARVDRVLDQLLDDRRRPLDHLARGDAVDEVRRKLLNDASRHAGHYREGPREVEAGRSTCRFIHKCRFHSIFG